MTLRALLSSQADGRDDGKGPPVRDWGARDPRWAGIRSEALVVASGGDHPPTEVHLLRTGPADGAPTLLVHGLGGSATNWLDVMTGLADEGPVVAVDLPGFGRTEPPVPRAARMRPQVRFLRALLDVLAWDRVRLHGNSMGGLLATLLAAEAPQRIERLVLTCPALPPPRDPAALSPAVVARFAPFLSWRLGGMVLERMYARAAPEVVRRETMQIVLGEADDVRPSMQQVQLENVEVARDVAWRLPSFARAATDLVHTLGTSRSVHRAVDAVSAPTLLVWGDHDRLVSRATMDAVIARRPDWARVDLGGVGHVPMLEDPDRWLAAVRGA